MTCQGVLQGTTLGQFVCLSINSNTKYLQMYFLFILVYFIVFGIIIINK
jgi:hypothetical protein